MKSTISETTKDVLGFTYFVTATLLFWTLIAGGIFFTVGIVGYPEFFNTPNNGELNK